MAYTVVKGNETHPDKEIYSSDVSYDDDEAIGQFVDYRYRHRDEWRAHFERQWYVNIAQFLGHQYHQWSEMRRTLFLPAAPRHRVRLVVNRLMPIVRRIVASTLRQRPQWTVSPATDDLEDEIIALLSTDVARYMWRDLDMNRKLISLLMWRSICGDAFARVYWDPYRGEKFSIGFHELTGRVPVDEEDRKRLEKEGRKIAEKEKYISPEGAKSAGALSSALGNVDVEVVSPFDFDPNPDATCWEEVTEAIHTKWRTRKWLKQRYGLEEDDLPKYAPDGHSSAGDYKEAIQNLGGISAFGFSRGQSKRSKELCAVNTVYFRPTAEEPTGWWAAVVGSKVVRKSRNEPGSPTFPWVNLKEIQAPNRFWGTCVLEQCIPIQAAYNRARSQIIEHVNTISRPPWLVPRGSGVKQSSITGEPGERIEFNWPLKPEVARPVELPNANHQNVAQVITDIEDVSNQHEASRGESPGRVDSGVGIAQLQEQDDGVLTPTNITSSDALAEIGAMALQIASTHWDEERLIKVVGEDKGLDVRYLTGKEMVGGNAGRPGVNYFDVRFELQSSLPASKAARQQLGIQLVQAGLLNPADPSQRERALEIMDIGVSPTSVSRTQMQKRRQRAENRELIAGGIPEIWEFDDHSVHIEEIEKWQNSPEYMREVKKTGGKESPIHIATELHKEAHAQQLQLELQAAQEVSGGGAPAPPVDEASLVGGGGGIPGGTA